MTERFMGVFRSVGTEPIGDARFAEAQLHRHRSVALGLIGLAVIAAPALLTAMAFELSTSDFFAVALSSWMFCPVVGAAFVYTGIRRYLRLRMIRAESDVEIFSGAAPMFRVPGPLSNEVDGMTYRMINARVVERGRTHRVVAHPETGVLLEVDGALVDSFLHGDVSITGRVPGYDPGCTTRALGALERRELQQLAKRVARTTWSRWLAFGALAVSAIAAVWSTSTKTGRQPELLVVWGVCACLLMIAILDAVARRSLSAKALRDAEAALRPADERWLLPESGITWEANGIPGPLRLAKGGLGSEADGRTRPVMF